MVSLKKKRCEIIRLCIILSRFLLWRSRTCGHGSDLTSTFQNLQRCFHYKPAAEEDVHEGDKGLSSVG